MALLLIEGFDDGLYSQRGWIGGASGATTGRFGGTALYFWFGDIITYTFPTPISGRITAGVAVYTQVIGDRYAFEFGNARVMLAANGKK